MIPMTNDLKSMQIILNLNTRLFANTLEGITEEHWNARVSDHNNPLKWIAAHVVSSRYLILTFLGKPAQNPYQELFANQRPYEATVVYPSLGDVKKEWEKVSALMKTALASPSSEALGMNAPFPLLIEDQTSFGAMAFFVEHESYEIGQLGFLKKYHTKEAMKYT